jgi:hypothetical protein
MISIVKGKTKISRNLRNCVSTGSAASIFPSEAGGAEAVGRSENGPFFARRRNGPLLERGSGTLQFLVAWLTLLQFDLCPYWFIWAQLNKSNQH